MGCGGAKNRGAGTPTGDVREAVVGSEWELKGKLPIVVLQGWARALGIPFLSPNRRTKKSKVARMQIAQPFANAEPVELHTEASRPVAGTGKVVPNLHLVIHTEQPVVSDRHTDGREDQFSERVVPPITPPVVGHNPVSLPSPPVIPPSANIEPQSGSQSGAASPLPPPQYSDESSDEGDFPLGDEAIRNTRLTKEEEAERLATRIAAEQRAVMEKQQAAQSLLMDEQKNQADAILSKYA